MAERFRFHRRSQGDESITHFAADLRCLSKGCEFGVFLNDALVDRFVCGIKNECIQRQLLREVDLTFSRALEIAESMEAAQEDDKV